MKGVKRMSKNLKYAPRRKMNLDATSYGPLIKLVIALAVLAALVLVVVFVALPLINARVSSGQPLFGNSPAVEPAKQTASPLNPILTNEVKTVQFGEGYGLPTAVVDPSVFGDEILFATGATENACDRLVRLNPETGAFENIALTRIHDTIRYPVESADVILYADCKSAGGGSIVRLDKATGETAVLAEFAQHAPPGSRMVLDVMTRRAVGCAARHASVRSTGAARLSGTFATQDEAIDVARARARMGIAHQLAQQFAEPGIGRRADLLAQSGQEMGAPFREVEDEGREPLRMQ